MAELSLRRWVAFIPDIGNNRTLPPAEQVALEVASSLTKEELLRFREQMKDVTLREGEDNDAARIRVLSEFVRLANGPHTLGGVEVKTLDDYVRVCLLMPDQYNLRELFSAVGYFNSLAGADALFSERRSGGTAFTLRRNAATDAAETDGL